VLQFISRPVYGQSHLVQLGFFLGFFIQILAPLGFKRGRRDIHWIAYGWLTIATAYYLQTQHFNPTVNWISIPVALSIFNVILINEFPDYSADIQAGKRNIVVRLGKEKSVIIYIIAAILIWVFFGISVLNGVPMIAVYCGILFFLVEIFIIISLVRKAYLEHKKLEMLAG